MKSAKLKNHPGIIIAAICLLALILRLLALMSLQNSLYADVLLWDERSFHELAVKLLKQSPPIGLSLYATLMAFIYKLFGLNILYIRVLNILFGVGTCFLLCLIGKELLNRKAGLAVGLIAALYKPFLFYDITLLNTSLTVFLFALTAYLLIKLRQNESMLKLFLLGLTAGLLYHLRPNAGLILPVLILVILIEPGLRRIGLKRAVLISLFFSLGLLSARAHILLNSRNRQVVASANVSQAGLNFYIGNQLENSAPYYRPVAFSTSEPRMQGVYFKIEADRRAGRSLTTREAASFWIGEVFCQAREKPWAFAEKQILKVLALCNRFEACDHYDIGFMSRFVRFFKWPFIPFWVVFPLGMTGIILTMRKTRIRQVLGVVFLVYAATLVLFFTNARYRLPILILLIPFGLLGLERFLFLWREKQWKQITLYWGVVVVFGILEFLPIPGAGDLTAYYNTHAIILNSKGRRSEALTYWEKSSQMNTSFAVFADLSLAGHHIRERNDERALYYLEKIPDYSFASAQKYELLGDIRIYRDQAEEAAAAYEKSLFYNSGQKRVLLKLIRIYEKTDRNKAGEKVIQLQRISNVE